VRYVSLRRTLRYIEVELLHNEVIGVFVAGVVSFVEDEQSDLLA
jgi:hypothetical protein